MTENIVTHIKDLLYVKRWSREQIVRVSTTIPSTIWEGLLCVNEKTLAFLACYDEAFEENQVPALLDEMKFHTVKVGFIYNHRDQIHLISTLSSKTDIRLLEEFMTPGELLAFIYGNEVQNSPYFILLPKLFTGALKLLIAFIDGLFSLFDKNEKKIVYYHPFDNNKLLEDRLLYSYLQEHYPDKQIEQINYCNDKSVPFAIIVPYEVRDAVVMFPKDEAQSQIWNNDESLSPIYINSKKVCVLTINDVRESSFVIEHFTHIIESLQTEHKVEKICNPGGGVGHSDISDLGKMTKEPSIIFSGDSYPNVEIEISDKSGSKIIKKYPKYEKTIINNINMARQTSYQTQIELASDLKRYLHGFQERLAEVAKNYQAKSHDLYEAGMMDETHKDFEENYVRETVAHIAGVVELINERDIPFVQKYIEKMEELREQYGS